MPIIRFIQTGVVLLGPALAFLVAGSGCDSGPEPGTQAKVDEKEQGDLQNKMKEFMQKKQGGGAPKK